MLTEILAKSFESILVVRKRHLLSRSTTVVIGFHALMHDQQKGRRVGLIWWWPALSYFRNSLCLEVDFRKSGR